MVNFWKLTYKSVKEQRDQYKKENEQLREQFDYMNQSYMKLYEENEKLKEELLQSDYVKASVLEDREEYKNRIIELTKENKALRLQSDTYFDEWQSDSSLFGFLIEHNVEFSIEDCGDVKVIEMGDWTEIHIIDSKYSVYHLRPCKSPIIKEFKSEKEVVNYLSNGVV